MTAIDLHARTGVPRNTLGTYLWELKRDGYVTRVGGVRGSYRYGLTEKGRERIGEGTDPMRQLARAVAADPEARKGFTDFSETLKVIDRLDEYRTLKAFAEWVTSEHAKLFVEPDLAPSRMHRCVLEHLGIDAATYRQQSRALIGLLEFMKETT